MGYYEGIDLNRLFDDECDNKVHAVADNLPEFIRLVLRNEPIDETLIEEE